MKPISRYGDGQEQWSTDIGFLTADADILESRVANCRYKAYIIVFILIYI